MLVLVMCFPSSFSVVGKTWHTRFSACSCYPAHVGLSAIVDFLSPNYILAASYYCLSRSAICATIFCTSSTNNYYSAILACIFEHFLSFDGSYLIELRCVLFCFCFALHSFAHALN